MQRFSVYSVESEEFLSYLFLLLTSDALRILGDVYPRAQVNQVALSSHYKKLKDDLKTNAVAEKIRKEYFYEND